MTGAVVSVIVVSDFESGGQRSWRGEREIFEALARQDIGQPFEVILLENERHRDAAPRDLSDVCPG
jgi:hypothetical protein